MADKAALLALASSQEAAERQLDSAATSVMGPGVLSALVEQASSNEFRRSANVTSTGKKGREQLVTAIVEKIIKPAMSDIIDISKKSVSEARIALIEQANKQATGSANHKVAQQQLAKRLEKCLECVTKMEDGAEKLKEVDEHLETLADKAMALGAEESDERSQIKEEMKDLHRFRETYRNKQEGAEKMLFQMFDKRLGG